MTTQQDLLDAAAVRARAASHGLALATRAQKDRALLGMTKALVDRLRLTLEGVAAMAHGLRNVAGLPDPVGSTPRQHNDAILTEDHGAARRFTAGVDSAVVLVNASTRCTGGAEFGFGAEIGISTQKLHARADGAGGDDVHQVRRHRERARPMPPADGR